MAAPPRYLNSVHDRFPDNDDVKEVWLYADGKMYSGAAAHVLLMWLNGHQDDKPATQIVQLTGAFGNYSYFQPVVKLGSVSSIEGGTGLSLGRFTRPQRDEVLALAAKVKFSKVSTQNGCRVWTRDHLVAMVEGGLLEKHTFDNIDQAVPLVKRVPEA